MEKRDLSFKFFCEIVKVYVFLFIYLDLHFSSKYNRWRRCVCFKQQIVWTWIQLKVTHRTQKSQFISFIIYVSIFFSHFWFPLLFSQSSGASGQSSSSHPGTSTQPRGSVSSELSKTDSFVCCESRCFSPFFATSKILSALFNWWPWNPNDQTLSICTICHDLPYSYRIYILLQFLSTLFCSSKSAKYWHLRNTFGLLVFWLSQWINRWK